MKGLVEVLSSSRKNSHIVGMYECPAFSFETTIVLPYILARLRAEGIRLLIIISILLLSKRMIRFS